MFSSGPQTILRTNPLAARLLTAAALFLLWRAGYRYLFEQDSGLGFRILSLPVVFLLGLAALNDALHMARLGRRPSAWWLAAGLLVIVGGIGFDGLAALAVTPDLHLETDPVIVTLWENRYPDWILYFTMGVGRLLSALIASALWTAFLRHVPIYLELIWSMDPHGLLQFLLTAIGFNPPRPFLRRRPGRYSRLYRLFCVCTLMLIAPFGRWLDGLDWLISRKILTGQPLAAWETQLYAFNRSDFLAYGGEQLVIGLAFLLWLTFAYLGRQHWRR